MSRKVYPPQVGQEDGWCNWVQPIRKGYRFCCCDCNLVHELAFRVKDGRIRFRARRRNRCTAALRREAKKR